MGPRAVRWRCRGERGGKIFKKKKKEAKFLHSVVGSGEGKKKWEQCRSKRHRSVSFFFFFKHETASFWIKRAVSFKKKAPE